MAKATLRTVIDFVNSKLVERGIDPLGNGASEEDVSSALAIISAPPKRSSAVPQFTPVMLGDGEFKLAGTKVRLASDEIDGVLQMLQSQQLVDFVTANAGDLATREEVKKARSQRRAANKQAAE